MRVKRKTGFTLIELLVVISIIGLLASIVLVSLNGARDKARQAKLKGDFAQIAKGIEISRNNNNKTMLGVTGSGCTVCAFGTPPQPIKSNPSALTTLNSSWKSLGFAASPLDPWGTPYLIDENEQEFGSSDCRYDIILSAGPNGVWDDWASPVFGVMSAGIGDDYAYAIPFFVCR